jgi:hypothetical protein
MAELDGSARTKSLELAEILGVSNEVASTFMAEGRVVLSEEKKLTFMRLHDVYQSLRKTAPNKGIKATA